MFIDNKSQVKTQRLRPLIDFVIRHTDYSYCASLQVVDVPGNRARFSGGKAWRRDPDPEHPRYSDARPSLAKICLSQGLRYPVSTKHVRETPRVWINSWEEEVILVLAHELRHIDQFWSWEGDWDDVQAEIDAEVFAISLLEKWRRSKTKRFDIAV